MQCHMKIITYNWQVSEEYLYFYTTYFVNEIMSTSFTSHATCLLYPWCKLEAKYKKKYLFIYIYIAILVTWSSCHHCTGV